jgi:hypothetical protein
MISRAMSSSLSDLMVSRAYDSSTGLLPTSNLSIE